MWWNLAEQSDLVATMRAAGPDAPTLCEGWRTRHLAAHLYLRGHEPWRAAGLVLPWARPSTEAHVLATGEAAAAGRAYNALLDAFAMPPAGVNPMRLASPRMVEAVNLLEYVVHHEDVRRANPSGAEPRDLPEAFGTAVWEHSARFASIGYRWSPVGVVLVVPNGPRRAARAGNTAVAITGEPVEIALYTMGRRAHARVRITGTDEAVAAFTAAIPAT